MDERPIKVFTAPVLKSRPTLDPLFTSRSSQGSQGTVLEESDSSAQPSSIGQDPSTSGSDADSRAGWLVQTNVVSTNNSSDTNSTYNTTLRRRTTKDLVQMFERRTSASTSSSSPASHPLKRGGIKQSLKEDLPSLPKSNQLRESFRNLFSAFSKAKRTLGEQQPNLSFHRGIRSTDNPGTSKGRSSPPSSTTVGELNVPSPVKPTISRLAPGLSPDIQNGILLYFDNDSQGPVWHQCEAFLATPTLRLSYFSPSGKSITKTIPINNAIDARSIASTNCATVAPPTLNGNSPSVFELEFPDGSTEKFAATSILERGGWISAVWDVIILAKSGGVIDKMSRTAASDPPLSLPTNSHDGESDESDEKDSSSQEYPYVSTKARLSPQRERIQRPPLPIRTNTDESTSNWSTANSSLTTSRSVRTLTGLSIVKQRLAQLDSITGSSTLNAGFAYATPPRTPPPTERQNLVSSSLSKGSRSSYSQPSPSYSIIQSPTPIRAPSLVSSRLSRITQSIERVDSSDLMHEADEETTALEMELESILRNDPSRTSAFISPGIASNSPIRDAESDQILVTEPQRLSITDDAIANIQERMGSLHEEALNHQNGLQSLIKEVSIIHRDVRLSIQQPPLPVPQLDDIKERLDTLANGLISIDLQEIHTKLDTLVERAQQNPDIVLKNEAPSSQDDVTQRLSSIEEALTAISSLSGDKNLDLSSILKKLDEMQEQYDTHDVPPPVPEKDGAPKTSVMDSPLEEFRQKLERLEALLAGLQKYSDKQESESTAPVVAKSLSVFSGRHREASDAEPAAPIKASPPEVLEILQIVKEDHEQRVSLADQFGDTVRYLHELNAWMEAFVNKTGGNDQILNRIADTMDKISRDPDASVFTVQNIETEGDNTEANGASINAQDKLSQTKDQESVLQDIKASIQAVLAAIQDHAERQAEYQKGQGMNAILATLDKNRQEQDAMLKSIADNLSADIRGERIRFVDAMRDATRVNVSAHLEEFKRQLSKEVLVMLQDVGKQARARERKHLEQEIAEIFNQQIAEQSSSRFHRPPSSTGFQPLPPSRPPTRPHSQGPYPAFMMPPIAEPGLPHNMPLHPNLSTFGGRPLPVPSPDPHPHYATHSAPMSIIPTMSHNPESDAPVRRKA